MSTDLLVILFVGAFVIFILWLRSESRVAPPAEPFIPPDPEPQAADSRPYELPDEPANQAEGLLKITTYSFAKIDWRVGPTDPNVVLDELTVEYLDRRTGEKWSTSYTVATPQGIAAELERSGKRCFIQNSPLFFFQRYDLDVILAEIKAFAEEMAAQVDDEEPEPEQTEDEMA